MTAWKRKKTTVENKTKKERQLQKENYELNNRLLYYIQGGVDFIV